MKPQNKKESPMCKKSKKKISINSRRSYFKPKKTQIVNKLIREIRSKIKRRQPLSIEERSFISQHKI